MTYKVLENCLTSLFMLMTLHCQLPLKLSLKIQLIQIQSNKDLQNINDWLKSCKLSVNIAKYKYMVFHTPQKRVKPFGLKIENTIVERVYEFNFLGLIMNENLNWKCHVNNIANKISNSTGILNKLKVFFPLNAKVLIYNSLILSHLNFCILTLGYQCDIIVKLQKVIVRILSLSKYNAHTEPIFKMLKLLKVNDILNLQEYNFYFKFKNNKLPHYLQNLPLNGNISLQLTNYLQLR